MNSLFTSWLGWGSPSPVTPEQNAKEADALNQEIEKKVSQSASDQEKLDRQINSQVKGWLGSSQGIERMAATIQVIMTNPTNRQNFFRDFAIGIKQGFSQKKASKEEEGDGDFVSMIFSGLREISGKAVGQITGLALTKILKNAKGYDLDSKDQKIFEDSLEKLKKMKSGEEIETVQEIRKRLTSYHVIVGGLDISQLLKWEEEKGEKTSVNPISTLIECQEALTIAKNTHELPSSSLTPSATPVECEKDSRKAFDPAQVQKTNEQLDLFCKKTAEMSTMKAVDALLGKKRSENEYKKLLQAGPTQIKEAYKGTFKGIIKVFSSLFFSVVYHLLHPILHNMLKKVIEDIRGFLRNESMLLKFSEEKIKDLSDYFGRLELAREQYLDTKNRADEAGTFSRFCEQTIKQFAGKFTEENLLSIFKLYIVNNYVPRPDCSIGGFRVPLLTSFTEWIILAIRKSVVQSYLKKSQIIETYLKEGTNSVLFAQLGFKRVIEKKLKEFKDVVDKNLTQKSKRMTVTLSPGSSSVKKTATISERILINRKTIEEFSEKLVRFIDIEGCNGDKRKLRQLDNRVDTLFEDLKHVLKNILPLETFSMNDTLQEACSVLTESAISSLFSTTSSQFEEQIQSSFELLSSSFNYFEKEVDQKRALQQTRDELKQVDEKIHTLLRELSQGAVKEAVSNKLENVSGERHKKIEDFVHEEMSRTHNWVNELRTTIQSLPEKAGDSKVRFENTKTQLGILIDQINSKLSHLSSVLRSQELEQSYTDVQQQLYSAYQTILNEIYNKIIPGIEIIAQSNKLIYENDQQDLISQTAYDFFQSLENKVREITKKSEKERAKAFSELESELSEKTKNLPLDSSNFFQRSYADAKQVCLNICEIEKKLDNSRTLKVKIQEKENYASAQTYLNESETMLRKLSRDVAKLKKLNLLPKIKVEEKESLKISIREEYSKFKTLECPEIATGLSEFLKEIQNPTTDDEFDLLDSKLNSGIFSRKRETAFVVIASLRKQNALSLIRLEKEISSIEAPIKSDEELLIELGQLRNKIGNDCFLIKTFIDQRKQKRDEITFEQLQTISQKKQELAASFKAIAEISKKPKVKGYITIGELQLNQTLSPKIISVLVPQIQSKLETVVKASSEPFHWKQLILRLMMVNIANRSTSSKSA